jgi:hypothetical protein
MRQTRRTASQPTLLAAVALAIAGCGLSDYEAKMLAEQQRVERFDRENKLLGPPLATPTAWREKAPAAPDVYLRPPRGVEPSPKERAWNDFLYHYAGNGNPFDRMYLAWAGAREDFLADVRRLIPLKDKPDHEVTTRPAAGLPAQTLSGWMIEDGDHVYYLYLDPSKKLAVIFRANRRAFAQQGRDAIEASLNTFTVGPEAVKQQAEYNRRYKGGSR